MPFSVNNILKDTKITLEKAATDKYGAVVEDFGRNLVNSALNIDPSREKAVNRNDGSWYATSYAATLAGGTFRPKLKFLFQVEFIFTQAAIDMYPWLNSAEAKELPIMIKSVDLFKVDFEFDEDVNMYNYRTKVLKKIRHRDLTMVLLDDTGNRVFKFIRTILNIHSPISRGRPAPAGKVMARDRTMEKPKPSYSTGDHTINVGPSIDPRVEKFPITNPEASPFNASRASVNSSFGNSIEAIRVKQIFLDHTGPLETASRMVIYDLMNPRIISMDGGELTHESSEPSQLTLVFDYDWMEMIEVGALGVGEAKYEPQNTSTTTGIHGAPLDISPNMAEGAQGRPQGDGILSGALNGLSRIAGRAVQQIGSDAINKVVRSVAGNGRFATSIGQATGNALGGALGSITTGSANRFVGNPLSGIVGGATRSIDRATERALKDNNVAGTAIVRASETSSEAYVGVNPAVDTSRDRDA